MQNDLIKERDLLFNKFKEMKVRRDSLKGVKHLSKRYSELDAEMNCVLDRINKISRGLGLKPFKNIHMLPKGTPSGMTHKDAKKRLIAKNKLHYGAVVLITMLAWKLYHENH